MHLLDRHAILLIRNIKDTVPTGRTIGAARIGLKTTIKPKSAGMQSKQAPGAFAADFSTDCLEARSPRDPLVWCIPAGAGMRTLLTAGSAIARPIEATQAMVPGSRRRRTRAP
jgi:hypothetical protein